MTRFIIAAALLLALGGTGRAGALDSKPDAYLFPSSARSLARWAMVLTSCRDGSCQSTVSSCGQLVEADCRVVLNAAIEAGNKLNDPTVQYAGSVIHDTAQEQALISSLNPPVTVRTIDPADLPPSESSSTPHVCTVWAWGGSRYVAQPCAISSDAGSGGTSSPRICRRPDNSTYLIDHSGSCQTPDVAVGLFHLAPSGGVPCPQPCQLTGDITVGPCLNWANPEHTAFEERASGCEPELPYIDDSQWTIQGTTNAAPAPPPK